MLWYKGWRETRIRLLVLLGSMGFYLLVFFAMRSVAAPPGPKPAAMFGLTATGFAALAYIWLAGAGIVTQPAFQAANGIHGSTLFTLSLPVSRIRLLAVRAVIGWLEMTLAIAMWCSGCWLVLPVIRGSATAARVLQYGLTLVACASALYFVSVLLATLLDDQWRMWGTMLAFGTLWLLSNYVPVPASVNLIQATIGDGSSLITHRTPWPAIELSLGLAAILLFAALKIAQGREY